MGIASLRVESGQKWPVCNFAGYWVSHRAVIYLLHDQRSTGARNLDDCTPFNLLMGTLFLVDPRGNKKAIGEAIGVSPSCWELKLAVFPADGRFELEANFHVLKGPYAVISEPCPTNAVVEFEIGAAEASANGLQIICHAIPHCPSRILLRTRRASSG